MSRVIGIGIGVALIVVGLVGCGRDKGPNTYLRESLEQEEYALKGALVLEKTGQTRIARVAAERRASQTLAVANALETGALPATDMVTERSSAHRAPGAASPAPPSKPARVTSPGIENLRNRITVARDKFELETSNSITGNNDPRVAIPRRARLREDAKRIKGMECELAALEAELAH